MTDGAGMISLDLAEKIPPIHGGCVRDGSMAMEDSAPLVTQVRAWLVTSSVTSPHFHIFSVTMPPPFVCPIQVRAWLLGSLSKGTLTTVSRLPERVMILRNSMVKIEPAATDACQTTHMLVCNTSEGRKHARLNANLIMLLDHGANQKDQREGGNMNRQRLHDYLLGLQDAEKPKIEAVFYGTAGNGKGRVKARERQRMLKETHMIDEGGADMLAKMLAAGHTVEEPYVASLLRRKGEEQFRHLRMGKLRLHEGSAGTFYAVPDFTRTLAADEVMVVRDGQGLPPPLELAASKTFPVLVYHAPGAHAGDVRKLCHRYSPDIIASIEGADHTRKNCVFFSTCGERATMDMLAGGDMDGDEVTRLISSRLHPDFSLIAS